MNKIKLKRGFYLEVEKCNKDGLFKYHLRKKKFLQETIFYNMCFLDIESAEDYIKYLR